MRDRLRVFLAVLRDPNLVRIELAFVGYNMVEYATWIAILVFAYARGGATMAGAIAVVQLIPCAIVAPLAAYAGDRFRRDRVLVAGYLAQALGVGLCAVALFAEAPVTLIYAAATVAAVSLTVTRPAMASILPSITRSPEDLTAANVASSIIEGAGIFLGPFLAGVILRASGAALVFAVMGGVSACSALLTWRLKVDPAAVTPSTRLQAEAVWRETFMGFSVLRRERDPRTIVALEAVQVAVIGALDVLFVAAAIDLLGLGEGGAGFLNASFGVGILIGGAAAVALVGRRRLTPALSAGTALFGLPLAAVGIVASPAAAPALIALGGGGRTLSDVSARTLLQRIAPDEVLSRVFGVMEGMGMAALAAGSAGASALIAAFGIRWALAVTGASLPAAVLLLWRRLLSIDAKAPAPDAATLRLLRAIPIFTPLPAPAIERVVANVVAVRAARGEVVIREGEAGDRFYVIAEGRAEVSAEGEHVAHLEAGGWFGEIALLRDVPRTATVTAATEMRLLALERDPFLEAVTGHPQSIEAADEVVRERSRG